MKEPFVLGRGALMMEKLSIAEKAEHSGRRLGSRRVGAYGLDFVVIAALLGIVTMLGWIVRLAFDQEPARFPTEPLSAGANVLTQLIALVPVLGAVLYFGLSESSAHQATWGKRVMGLKVAGSDGGRVSVKSALIRSVIKFMPWQVAHLAFVFIPGGLGGQPSPAALALWSASILLALWYVVRIFRGVGTTPYDRVAGPRVVPI